MTDCPFPLCTANIVLVVEQLRPDDDELTTLRVPEHMIEGFALRMTCPASLLGMPLGAYATQVLEEQASVLGRMLADKAPPAPPEQSASTPERYSRTPSPYWFQNSTGDPNGPYPPEGPTARPKLRLISGGRSSEPTTTGRDVASAAEIGEAIWRAVTIMVEGKESVFVGGGKLGEALQILNVVRETSSDSLGTPQLTMAIDLMDEASLLIEAATQSALAYRGSL